MPLVEFVLATNNPPPVVSGGMRGTGAGDRNAEARQLAQQIVDAQQAEIDEMRALLDKS